MLEKKISIKSILIGFAIISVGVFLFHDNLKFGQTLKASSTDSQTQNAQYCDYNVIRLNGYKFIKPLLFVEPACESGKYSGLKFKILDEIKHSKDQMIITRASVYLKDFKKGEWMSINETESYHPSSLIKVPMLITYLLMSQKNPNLLNTKLVFEKPPMMAHQTFNSYQITEGKSYSIKELLKYMVVYSDNNATYMLNTYADMNTFYKLYSDLGLPVPDVHDNSYTITPRNYSQFLRVIFSGNYLTIDNSEYAAELLNQCDFKDGIQKALPKDVSIAHKFGEWGNGKGMHQLSESGIIYLNNNPYLLTIMTEGNDIKQLPNLIANISKQCYDFMNSVK